MAEAAALALAAAVIKALQLDHTTMLSDNQQLVHFLNGQDQEHPPDWRVKPFTQLIKISLQGKKDQVYTKPNGRSARETNS
jgi:hypothetical protein